MSAPDRPSNPALEYLRANIGQSTQASPSPYARWVNGTLRAVDWGEVRVEITVREEMTNPLGTLHGGVIAGVMDEFVGMALASAGVMAFASINLTVDFLRSTPKGHTVFVKAKVVRVGRHIVYATCTVEDTEGKLLANGTSNLFRLDGGGKAS